MSAINGLAWTFNTESSLYEKMRPGYVDELYEDIFRVKPIDPSCLVLEIGLYGDQQWDG